MDFLYVAIGGAFGSLARFSIGSLILKKSKRKVFPYATFLINISGAFALGVIIRFELHNNLQLLFMDGFLGAYTTFSTFMYEGNELILGNKRLYAFIYILLSLMVGLFGFFAGFSLMELLFFS